MRAGRVVLRAIAEGCALGRLLQPPRPGLRILMYHSVGSRALGDSGGSFSITPKRFRAHVELLASFPNATTVRLEPGEVPQAGLRVAVTFDDGYRDNLSVAAPILGAFKIPFTVFISTDHVRSRAVGFLEPADLVELAQLPNVTIGAHGKSHRPLTGCTDADLTEELWGSKQYLEDLLGRQVSSVAYPFGAVDLRVRTEAGRLGFALGVGTRFDINSPGADQLVLSRCNIERDDTTRVFRQKLQGDWDWYRWRTRDVRRRSA